MSAFEFVAEAIGLLGSAASIASWIQDNNKADEFDKRANEIVSEALKSDIDRILSVNDIEQTSKMFMDEKGLHFVTSTYSSLRLIEAIKGFLVIDPSLLKVCAKMLITSAKAHADELTKYSGYDETAHRMRADMKAQNIICETLNRIRRHNAEKLPAGLESYWASYRCVEF